MSVNIRPLSEPLAKVAREQLNEVPERIPEDIAALRSWIEKQPHIRGRTDDQFLVTFLRGCKYSLERAKEKYDMYYTLRSAIPEFFANRDPTDPKILEIFRLGSQLPLKETVTPDGPRIIVSKFNFDPSKHKIEETMKVSIMIRDIMMMEDDNLVVSGQKGFMDCSGMTMAHMVHFTPSLGKKLSLLSQDGSPLRMKGAYNVNVHSAVETLFNFFKGFLNEKNQKRMFVYGKNYEAVYEEIPKRILPVEYGGESGSVQDLIAEWEKKLLEYRDYFLEDYGVDESKRPGKPKNAESLFGVDGSFRKLNVD